MSAPLFISWVKHHGRSADLADRLGASAEFISVGRQGRRVAVLWRYPVQTLRTVAVLRRCQPQVLVVMAPPLPLVLIALSWARRHGGSVVIDAHTGAVVSPRTGRPRRRFAVLARHADLVLVTRPELAALLPGVRALVLDDAPVDVPDVAADHERRDGLPVRVVYPCSWYADEPVADVLAAAHSLPGVEFVLTGTPRGQLTDIADNVTLTGYTDHSTYWSLLRGADLALALTTREHTMQRAGYEALAAGVPLVVSGTDALTSWYGAAAQPAGQGRAGVVRAITAALRDREALVDAAAALRARRDMEFEAALRTLCSLLRLDASDAQLREQRCEAVVPAVSSRRESPRVRGKSAAQLGITEQPRERSGELVGSVSAQVVNVGDSVDAADAERRRHHRNTGAEGVEHLEPAATAAVNRHDHRGHRRPHRRQVVDEAERAYPLDVAHLRGEAAAPHDRELDESLSPG